MSKPRIINIESGNNPKIGRGAWVEDHPINVDIVDVNSPEDSVSEILVPSTPPAPPPSPKPIKTVAVKDSKRCVIL